MMLLRRSCPCPSFFFEETCHQLSSDMIELALSLWQDYEGSFTMAFQQELHPL